MYGHRWACTAIDGHPWPEMAIHVDFPWRYFIDMPKIARGSGRPGLQIQVLCEVLVFALTLGVFMPCGSVLGRLLLFFVWPFVFFFLLMTHHPPTATVSDTVSRSKVLTIHVELSVKASELYD